MKLRIEINIWVLLMALFIGLLVTTRRGSKVSQAEAAAVQPVKAEEPARTRYNRVRDQETGGGFNHRRRHGNANGQPRKTVEEQIEELDQDMLQKSGLDKIFEGRYQVVEQQS